MGMNNMYLAVLLYVLEIVYVNNRIGEKGMHTICISEILIESMWGEGEIVPELVQSTK
jgi:hypothetical protein